MNTTNFADLDDFSNCHSLYFSIGHVLMLAKAFEKNTKKWKVFTRWTVGGFYGID
jgi:hypothetical protein